MTDNQNEEREQGIAWIVAVRDAAVKAIGDMVSLAMRDADENLYNHPLMPQAIDLLMEKLRTQRSMVEVIRHYCNAMELMDLIEWTNNHKPEWSNKQ